VSWFHVTRGRLEYRGRITRDPFTKWAATQDGLDAIARAASTIRFSLIGRSRSARRRIWRALEAASRVEVISAAIAAEATRYMQVLASLSYADGLPRTNIALHRLVLAPRAMIVGRAHAGVFERLAPLPALAGLNQLVIEMDAALQKASPSPRRPVQATDGWACVGVSVGTVWVDRILAGADGTGHVFMYEFPPLGLVRRERKAVEAAIQQMAASATALSRAERASVVRAAALRLS